MVFDVFGRGSKTPPGGASGAPPGKGKPLHLLQYDESSKKFNLGEEALDALRQVRGPVGVLSVCGRARQGKSFILNQLAGAAASNSGGFEVGPTVRPCTKGLWIWSAPILRHTPDGTPYHLILLDTEGIDAYDQTGQYSTQIFSMAVLLSSLFVYNQMGGIDEAALDRLSLVTEMTKHIRVKSDEKSKKQTTESELGRFSPSFVWLLRDFYLDFEGEGDHGIQGPAEYLERALRNVSGSGPGVESKNAIRDSIKSLFPSRECFPLVRPVNDEKELRNLDSLDSSKLRPEFKEGLGRLIDTLFTRCGPKMVGADVLNGASLAAMAQMYVKAINGGAVPAIATAWQSVAEGECRKASQLGEEAFWGVFYRDADVAGADESEINGVYDKALGAALLAFDDSAVGAESSGPRRGAKAAMESTLQKRKQEYVAKRFSEAKAACATRLAQAGNRVRAIADAADATVDTVIAAADAEASAIDSDSSGLGSVRHELLTHWLREICVFTVGSVARRTMGRLTRDLEAEKERSARDAKEAKAATERAQASEKQASEATRQVSVFTERCANAERAAAESTALLKENEVKSNAATSIKDSELLYLKREMTAAVSEATQLKQALEVEKGRCDDISNKRKETEKELAEARRDGATARANVSTAVTSVETDLKYVKSQLAVKERELEKASSAVRDAQAVAKAEVSEARAVAAGSVAAADAAANEAKRRATESEQRAKVAERELERLQAAATARRDSLGGKRGKKNVGGDDPPDLTSPNDDTFSRWREEAEAAATAAAGPEAATEVLHSPGKRRRSGNDTTDGNDSNLTVEEVAAQAGGDDDEGDENDASKRATAKSMTVAQLKHELQVLGRAHLYVGKKGVKKANLVDMFVNGE